MINVRHSVFETNSSSSHSISISNECELLETIFPINGKIVLGEGNYGSGWIKFNDAKTKADYAAIFVEYNEDFQEVLKQVISKQTGVDDVVLKFDGIIDHQSTISEGGNQELYRLFDDPEALRNWIFNPKCFLFLGSDGGTYPPNFYDPPDTKYKFRLKLEKNKSFFNFKEYPTDEELKEALSCLFYSQYYCFDKDGRFRDTYKGHTLRDYKDDPPNSFDKISENVITAYNMYYQHEKWVVKSEMELKFKVTKHK